MQDTTIATKAELAERLSLLEDVVDRNRRAFEETMAALAAIHAEQLYRVAGYANFGDYCQQRWNFKEKRAYQLLQALETKAEVRAQLSTRVDIPLPTNEAQLRAIRGADQEDWGGVWEESVTRTPEGKEPTGPIIREVVEEFQARRSPAIAPVVEVATFDMENEDDRALLALGAHFGPKTPSAAIAPPAPAECGGHPVNLHANESVEWYTPADVIEAAREVMGGIDLDPASCAEANGVVRAARYYSPEDGEDGLALSWAASSIFLNPPYGKDSEGESNQGKWLAKLIHAYRAGQVREAIALVNASTSDGWFQDLWEFPICFTAKRLRFWRPGEPASAPRYGSALIYLGEFPERFAQVFEGKGIGAVVMRLAIAGRRLEEVA